MAPGMDFPVCGFPLAYGIALSMIKSRPIVLILAIAIGATPALADKIRHPTAVFAGLDKITGRIIAFDVAGDETVQFGSLQVTPRACFTRPATEAPQTTGFVEIEEVVTSGDNKKIFSGWMFAASPGLHGVEHAVYDVWLTDCKGGATIIRETAALPEENVLSNPARPTDPGSAPRPRLPAAQQARPNPGALPSTGALPRPTALAPPPVVAAQPRRAPSQSFFPTAAQPGESVRDRQRFD